MKGQVALWPTVTVRGQGGCATHTEPQSCPACGTSIPASSTDTVTRTQEESEDPKWEAGVSGNTAVGAAGGAMRTVVMCWGCQRAWGIKKESLQLKKTGRNKPVFTGTAGVQGLFLKPSQGPLPTDALTHRAVLHLMPCRAQPSQEEAVNTSLCFWKPLLSSSPSSLTFLRPLSSCCTAQRREAQLPQLWILPPGFARSSPISEESPKLSLLSFPYSLLAAIYYSAVLRGGMQPVPGKGLLLPGFSRLSLVPGSARDRLSNTNKRLDFSLPQFPSGESRVPSRNLPRVGACTIIQLVHTAPVLQLLPWPRSQSTFIVSAVMVCFHQRSCYTCVMKHKNTN